jgi:hypothetical protein
MTRIALAGLLSIVVVPATAGPDALGCFTRTYDRAHLARHPDQLAFDKLCRDAARREFGAYYDSRER